MAICVPVKEMKDTAAFARLVDDASGPITVTRNGYDVFVVMRSEDYEAMQEEIAKTKLLARIAQAENEYATAAYSDGRQVLSEIREKHGL